MSLIEGALPEPWCIGGKIGNQAVIDYIRKALMESEHIIATILGTGEKTSVGALFGSKAGAALGGSYLLLTNQKAVIMKAGVGTWATGSFGLKAKTFLFEHIASVDVSRGILFGELEIVSPGMMEKSSGGFFSGAEKDSVLQFDKKYFDDVQQLAGKILALAQQSRMPRNAVEENIPGKIKQLAELKDAGILTEDEFADKKKYLLSKL
jgi:hypothetical protein